MIILLTVFYFGETNLFVAHVNFNIASEAGLLVARVNFNIVDMASSSSVKGNKVELSHLTTGERRILSDTKQKKLPMENFMLILYGVKFVQSTKHKSYRL